MHEMWLFYSNKGLRCKIIFLVLDIDHIRLFLFFICFLGSGCHWNGQTLLSIPKCLWDGEVSCCFKLLQSCWWRKSCNVVYSRVKVVCVLDANLQVTGLPCTCRPWWQRSHRTSNCRLFWFGLYQVSLLLRSYTHSDTWIIDCFHPDHYYYLDT